MDRYPLKTFAHYLNQPFSEDSFSGALRAVLKAVDHNGQLPKLQRRGSYKAVLDEARGKLRALAEKYQAQGKRTKARRIRRYNLGHKKQRAQRERQQQTIAHQINTALHEVTQNTDVLVSENLSASFRYGAGKRWNRRLSAWVRGVLQERTAFKALAGCSGHQQVNPAYTSQTCPRCGFVHAHNRHRDRFQCSHCGFAAHADRVAATNLLTRVDDHEITLYTPYQRVKAILEERFHRRQESEGPALMRGPSGPLAAGLEIPHEQAQAA